jgi:hypothetical protein
MIVDKNREREVESHQAIGRYINFIQLILIVFIGKYQTKN